MITVHKYAVPRDNALCRIMMPRGARVLHGDHQGTDLFVWAGVNTEAESMSPVSVAFVGTGYEIPDTYSARFVNTFLMENGALVFHAYAYGDN